MTFVFDCGFDMIDLKFSELSQTYESSIWDVGFDLVSHPNYRPDFPKNRPAFENKNPNWVIIKPYCRPLNIEITSAVPTMSPSMLIRNVKRASVMLMFIGRLPVRPPSFKHDRSYLLFWFNIIHQISLN